MKGKPLNSVDLRPDKGKSLNSVDLRRDKPYIEIYTKTKQNMQSTDMLFYLMATTARVQRQSRWSPARPPSGASVRRTKATSASAHDLSAQPLAGTQRVPDRVGRMTGHASLSSPGLSRHNHSATSARGAHLRRPGPTSGPGAGGWEKEENLTPNSFAKMATNAYNEYIHITYKDVPLVKLSQQIGFSY